MAVSHWCAVTSFLLFCFKFSQTDAKEDHLDNHFSYVNLDRIATIFRTLSVLHICCKLEEFVLTRHTVQEKEVTRHLWHGAAYLVSGCVV